MKIGDKVLVQEKELLWVSGPWTGTVMKISRDKSKLVRPDSDNLSWRVRPHSSYFQTGLYLTAKDSVRKI